MAGITMPSSSSSSCLRSTSSSLFVLRMPQSFVKMPMRYRFPKILAYKGNNIRVGSNILVDVAPYKDLKFLHVKPGNGAAFGRTKRRNYASSSSSYETTVVPAKDRILSAVSYLLPFFNGLNFGAFLFDRFPILEIAFDPIVPLFSFYKSIPGANFMAFLALCFGVVRDRGFSRYVRRNALQATMLDVLLALPSLVNIVFDSNQGLKFQLLEISYGATFTVIVAGFLYAFVSSVLGRNPSFPFVSEAVDWQLSAVDRQF